MKPFLSFILLALVSFTVVARDTPSAADTEPRKSPTLAELAQGADFIGLVQVQSIEYEYTRDLPSKGFALLSTLIVYRHPGETWEEAPRFIQVYEKGFKENACYYPERWDEGRRYLVFLEKRDKDGYQGMWPGCMLPVLITGQLRYALRYPIPGVELADPSVVRKLSFNDPDAYIKRGADIEYSMADSFAESGYLKKTEDGLYLFTHGVLLGDARELMFSSGSSSAAEDNRAPDDPSA